MSREFTFEAKILWDTIPPQIQVQLINNVWCPHCSSETTITNFKGDIEQKSLVLRGNCLKCGGSVARVIENE